MTTVRDATLQLLRAYGMTTIFGNPGSTELPMLTQLPDDFTYVLGLQELAVVGIADGFAQASGRVAHVNLHTGPGVGNAVGGILNARANRSPLLITAGQQARAQITIEATLTNTEATLGPAPYVKYAHEPPRAQDVPTALARAIHHAMLPPRGPAFVSIPMDDWAAEADEDRSVHARDRVVHGRVAPDPVALAALADRLRAAARPALVVGPEVDASGAWEDVVALAQEQRLAVWAPPVTGGSRIGFPEAHAQFQGILPPAIGPLAQTLEGHDLVLVVGSQVFAYYPYIPGPLLPAGTELVALTADMTDAARAPMGEVILGDVGLALSALRERAGVADPARRPVPGPRAQPQAPPEPPGSEAGAGAGAGAGRLSLEATLDALAHAWPADGICVAEAPSAMLALRDRLRLSRPASWYFSASGGLGFGIAAAVGVQMAQPDRPVVCVLGEGSAQYGITALWTAVAYRVPVTFLVLRNDEYAILKWFAKLTSSDMTSPGVTSSDGEPPYPPGLDLPGLDTAAIARAYGVDARDVNDAEALVAALHEAICALDGPRLIQVPIAADGQ
jgi:benzoylformate decarboxylase